MHAKSKKPLGAMLLLLLWVVPCDDTRAQDDDTAALGTEIFEEFCGACHGYDGVALLPGAPSFSKGERLEKSDADLLKSIREGKGDIMPAWQDILSDEECEMLLHFVRDLGDTTD